MRYVSTSTFLAATIMALSAMPRCRRRSRPAAWPGGRTGGALPGDHGPDLRH